MSPPRQREANNISLVIIIVVIVVIVIVIITRRYWPFVTKIQEASQAGKPIEVPLARTCELVIILITYKQTSTLIEYTRNYLKLSLFVSISSSRVAYVYV